MLAVNGQVFASDASGQQIPLLQSHLILHWAEQAEKLGYDVDGLEIEIESGTLVLHRGPDGWNYTDK